MFFELIDFRHSHHQSENRPINTQWARDSLFGDGFFTTGVIENHQLLNSEYHFDRLESGARSLLFENFDLEQIKNTLKESLKTIDKGILRLSVTRSQAERGYAVSKQTQISVKLVVTPWTSPLKQDCMAFFADTPVSVNPRLAGIKHLNRLDNVLAANECLQENSESIMCIDEQVVCGSRSNLFCLINNIWKTPELDLAGIEGITRARIIESMKKQDVQFAVTRVSQSDLLNSQAAFVCNSLLGIWPISQIEDKKLDANLARHLQSQLDFTR
ncbi:aminodeoxychorismate lyase [Aliikangiella marina]|uniref:aminodeoxychorismate lyase n=1 Tax=Aliikangiella marina TaxID=1712262 RepID=UPI00163DC964|nr:aminodeoxychorismate lyase [Aliikangiella marina]